MYRRTIFSDTIANNINFSKETLDMDEVITAAKLADVHDNIIEFPDQYDSVLGERGTTVSGGQKQRIAIARALIKDAQILIMDDSVSAVDTNTEKTILENLRRVRKGKTTILIAHRISTVQSMDKIALLDEGRLIGFGTHDELLETCLSIGRWWSCRCLKMRSEVREMNETAQVRLTDRKMIRRLSKYMKGNVWKFIFAGLLMLLSVALNLLLPYLLGKAARLLGEANDYREILLTVLLYALCMAMVFVFQYFQAIILQKAGQDIIFRIREDVFSHIQTFSTNQFTKTPVGKLVTRVTNDTNTLSEMYTSVLIDLLKNVFTIIGVMTAMLILNARLTLWFWF